MCTLIFALAKFAKFDMKYKIISVKVINQKDKQLRNVFKHINCLLFQKYLKTLKNISKTDENISKYSQRLERCHARESSVGEGLDVVVVERPGTK